MPPRERAVPPQVARPGWVAVSRQEAGRTGSLVLAARWAPAGLGPSSTGCRSLGMRNAAVDARSAAPPECSPGPCDGQRTGHVAATSSAVTSSPLAQPGVAGCHSVRRYRPALVTVADGRRGSANRHPVFPTCMPLATDPTRTPDPSERRIRRAWWAFAVSFVALVADRRPRAAGGPRRARSIFSSGRSSSASGIAAIRSPPEPSPTSRPAAGQRRSRSRGSSSSLSRSVSPDAVVAAIVDELARATGADHIVVARRRGTPGSSRRVWSAPGPGVGQSTTHAADR